MSHDDNSSRQNIIGILVAVFIAVFAGLLLLLYSPWDGIGEPSGQTPVLGQEAVQTPQTVTTSVQDMPVLELELDSGMVKIQLRPDLAPEHVAQITKLANEGFYDGIVFHRVIDGFMAQTGDPTGTGMGGSELPDLKAEFSDTPFVRGIVGMARSQDPDSANSQFFIVYDDARSLDGQYTVVGEVISGMEYVDDIKKGSPSNNGQVDDPDAIVSVRVVNAE